MVRLHTRENTSSSSPQPLQPGTCRRKNKATSSLIPPDHLQFKPVLRMPLNQDMHWMGSKLETKCESFMCVSESRSCLKNRTHRETATEPFLPANIIFIWLGIFQISFMSASNQDSLMRDDKQLIDVLINRNLVPFFYCNMSCFVILEKAGI